VPCDTSVRKITIAAGKVELIAGHPPRTSQPTALAVLLASLRISSWPSTTLTLVDTDTRLFASDFLLNAIRQITIPAGA
jgi:hypothetical protein